MRDAVPPSAFPQRDEQCAAFARDLGLPGYFDVHVHLLPDRLQEAVWDFFGGLEDPPWPITYRDDEAARLATLRELGVVAHTALAYAHRPGMLRWLNDHTLDAAEAADRIVPTFTFHPEPGVADEVERAITRGGRIAKVHLQVGRFHPLDPRLDEVWPQLVAAGVPALIHASGVYGVEGGHEFCGPDTIRALVERHSTLRVIVAHLGMPDHDGFLELAERTSTVSLDTSMALTDPVYRMAYPAELRERLVALVDRGQVLFGSDFPSIPHTYAAQIRGLAPLGLDVSGLRGVLYENAVRLVGMSTAS